MDTKDKRLLIVFNCFKSEDEQIPYDEMMIRISKKSAEDYNPIIRKMIQESYINCTGNGGAMFSLTSLDVYSIMDYGKLRYQELKDEKRVEDWQTASTWIIIFLSFIAALTGVIVLLK